MRGREAIRGMKTLKPETLAEGQALHAKTTPEPSAPDICRIKGVEVHVWDTCVKTDSYTLRVG